MATCGLQKGPLSERLARKHVCTVAELFDKTEEYTRAEEDSTQRAEVRATAAPPPPPCGPPGKDPAATAAEAATKPQANNYRRKGQGVYHVDNGQPP